MTIHVFVFGSNREGRHGAGAAAHAIHHYGAVRGQAEGLQGTSYAIITKELRSDHLSVNLAEIEEGVQRFLAFVRSRPDMIFRLTPIGCGLAGFKPEDVAPFFRDSPPNVMIPPAFERVLNNSHQQTGKT